MAASSPQITVILTTCERPQYLAQAIDSLLNQSFGDFELLIIDDASTNPEPRTIAAQYAGRDKRIRTIALSERGGVARARNRGLKEACGEYIVIHDDDDASLPDRFAIQADFLQQNPDISAVAGSYQACDAQLKPIHPPWPQKTCRYPAQPPPEDWGTYSCTNIASMMRRDCLREVGGFCPWFTVASDWDMTFRLQSVFPTAAIPQVAVHYRRRHPARQLTDHPLLWNYHCVAVICAWYRRIGRAEPIGTGVDVLSLMPLLKQLPVEFQRVPVEMAGYYLGVYAARGQFDQALRVYETLADFCDEQRLGNAISTMLKRLEPQLRAAQSNSASNGGLERFLLHFLPHTDDASLRLAEPGKSHVKDLMRARQFQPLRHLISQFAGLQFKAQQLQRSYREGNYAEALRIYRELLPLGDANQRSRALIDLVLQLHLREEAPDISADESQRQLDQLLLQQPLSLDFFPVKHRLTAARVKQMMRHRQFRQLRRELALHKAAADEPRFRQQHGKLRRKAIKYAITCFRPMYLLS